MIWYLTGFQEAVVFCDNKTSTTRGAQEPIQLYFCIDPHGIRVTHFKISISLETKQISFSLKEEMMAGDHQEKLTQTSAVVTMVYHRCCTKMLQTAQSCNNRKKIQMSIQTTPPKKGFSSETQMNPPVVQSLLLLALICRPCPACGLSWGRL